MIREDRYESAVPITVRYVSLDSFQSVSCPNDGNWKFVHLLEAVYED